jgi:hypothetical protein
MPEKKKLEWGQTPWDDLSREELLKTIWRMYMVIVELNSVTQMELDWQRQKAGFPSNSLEIPNVYWGKSGFGGKALEMARQVLEPLENEYEDETIYRAFFRYASDLLFEKNGYEMIGADWVTCPECGVMYATRMRSLVGEKCTEHPAGKPECPGALRKLIWDDLKPDAWKGKIA